MAKATDTPPLDSELVREALARDASRFALEVHATCESTNALLLDVPPPEDGRIAAVACDRQTAGRGRRGRPWLAWPGASLTFSAQWQFDADAPAPAGLSLVAGLAVATVLEQLGVAGVELKWPNDVQVHGRKLAGILVELSGARPTVAVVGIGLNLTIPPGETVPGREDVTALDQVMDAVPTREQLLAELLRMQRTLFDTYASTGFAAFVGAWNQRNAYADLPVWISGEGEVIEGICLGVDDDGALRVRTDAGTLRVIAGDVSLRLVA